ncbi:MAG: hypothetical protein KAG97_02280, partial [Victivallales bacterium]|nr:hypothetical protein [Victivallales bacterium]
VAIPLVGVLVQLGILIGVVGAIPIIGKTAALVFGAANYLVAAFFIFTAWLGSVAFPYPPTPKPSVAWMLTYYAVIGAALLSQLWLPKARTLLYSISARKPQLVPAAAFAVAILASGFSTYNLLKPASAAELTLDVVKGSSTPVVVVSGVPGGALVINSGSSFLASRTIKNLLLARGEISVDTSVATGRSPSDGAEGFAKLAEKLPIKRLVFPAFAGAPDGSFAVPDDPAEAYEAYFKAIGMKKRAYKPKTMKRGSRRRRRSKRKPKKNRWVVKCLKAYKALLVSPAAGKLKWVKYPAVVKADGGVHCEILTSVKGTYPASVMLTVDGKRHLIVGDPANRELAKLAPEKLACDQLILGAPTSLKATYYFKGLKTLLAKIAPKKTSICVDASRMSDRRQKAVEKCAELCGIPYPEGMARKKHKNN